jgi:hypothetical protein
MTDDPMFEHISKTDHGRLAPARLKSRVYTALIHAQQEDGALETLSATKQAGRSLCVFEQLVEIAPVGAPAKSKFYCTACHARILAEHMENAPIWWPHCPYSDFQKP